MKIVDKGNRDRKINTGTTRHKSRLYAAHVAFGISLLCAFPLTAGAQPPTDASAEATYRILTGDSVAIEVFGKPELSRGVVVGTDGKVTYLLLGNLQAAGRTTAELADRVRSSLAKELNNPQVTVTVIKRRVARLGANHRKTAGSGVKSTWRVQRRKRVRRIPMLRETFRWKKIMVAVSIATVIGSAGMIAGCGGDNDKPGDGLQPSPAPSESPLAASPRATPSPLPGQIDAPVPDDIPPPPVVN